MIAKIAPKIVTLTPALDTSAFASGDQIGPGSSEVADCVWGAAGLTYLIGIHIVDGAKQSAAFDLIFWNRQPTVTSTENNAFDVTDAECLKYAGAYSIAAADYKSFANNSVVTYQNFSMPLKASVRGNANPTGKSLWMSIVSRGTPTYAASSLQIQLIFAT